MAGSLCSKPVQSKVAARVKRLVGQMTPRLRQAYKEIRKLFSQRTVREARGRYKIAVLIKRVRDGEGGRMYGTGALANLAAALGRSVETLRQYAAVAETWSEQGLKEVVARNDAYGKRISWSHLVLLAGVCGDDRRDLLIEATLAESLSVRDLKRRIEAEGAPGRKAAAGAAHTPFRAGVRGLLAQAQAITNNVAIWQGTLFEPMKTADPAKFDKELLADLEQARDLQQEAGKACEKNAGALGDCIKVVKQALLNKKKPAKKPLDPKTDE